MNRLFYLVRVNQMDQDIHADKTLLGAVDKSTATPYDLIEYGVVEAKDLEEAVRVKPDLWRNVPFGVRPQG